MFLKGTNDTYNWEKTLEIAYKNWLSLRRFGKFKKFLNPPTMSTILCTIVFVLKEKEARGFPGSKTMFHFRLLRSVPGENPVSSAGAQGAGQPALPAPRSPRSSPWPRPRPAFASAHWSAVAPPRPIAALSAKFESLFSFESGGRRVGFTRGAANAGRLPDAAGLGYLVAGEGDGGGE